MKERRIASASLIVNHLFSHKSLRHWWLSHITQEESRKTWRIPDDNKQHKSEITSENTQCNRQQWEEQFRFERKEGISLSFSPYFPFSFGYLRGHRAGLTMDEIEHTQSTKGESKDNEWGERRTRTIREWTVLTQESKEKEEKMILTTSHFNRSLSSFPRRVIHSEF